MAPINVIKLTEYDVGFIIKNIQALSRRRSTSKGFVRIGLSVPDLGLWRPLGNNIIENTSTPWPNKFNDC